MGVNSLVKSILNTFQLILSPLALKDYTLVMIVLPDGTNSGLQSTFPILNYELKFFF